MRKTILARCATGLALVAAALPIVPGLALAHRSGVAAEATLRPTPFANDRYGPGVISGSARLVTDGRGRTRVVARLEGLEAGTRHAGHIHFGDCQRLQPGAIIQDLEPFVADERGRAVSRTLFEGSMTGLEDGDWWLAVHEGAVNTTPQSPAIAIGAVLIRDGRDACE